MDLNALSAQLSRLKLSQRLFIEADLLPEELVSPFSFIYIVELLQSNLKNF